MLVHSWNSRNVSWVQGKKRWSGAVRSLEWRNAWCFLIIPSPSKDVLKDKLSIFSPGGSAIRVAWSETSALVRLWISEWHLLYAGAVLSPGKKQWNSCWQRAANEVDQEESRTLMITLSDPFLVVKDLSINRKHMLGGPSGAEEVQTSGAFGPFHPYF